MRRHRIWICAALGVLLCVGAWWSTSVGQPVAQASKTPAPEKLCPADSVFYMTSDGLDPHQEAWKKTAAYEALHESGVLAIADKLVTWALEQGQPESAGFARAAFETLGRKGFTLAIGFPSGQKGPAIPQVVAVVHEGADLKPALSQMIRESTQGDLEFADKRISGRTVTVAAIPAGPGVEIGWWAEGKHLVIAGGANAIASTLDVAGGKSPDITKHRLWKTIREGEGRHITSVSWLDVQALTARFSDVQVPAGDVVVTVGSIIESLGLDGLKTIVTRGGIEGRALWSESKVETTGERKGILAMLDQKPISLEDLPPLPVDTTGFSVASLDLGKSYDDILGIMRSVAKLGPEGASEELNGLISQLPQALGLDLKKDLFDPLGNVVCGYNDSMHGTFGFGIAGAFQVDDAATLRKTLDSLLGRIEDESDGIVAAVRTQKTGREIVSLQFARVGVVEMLFGLSYTVDQKWLVVGLNSQTVEAFLLRLDGKLPTLQSTPGFAEMVKGVPKSFSGLTISDPKKTYGLLLSWAPSITSVFQMFNARLALVGGQPAGEAFPFTAADLPPAELFVRPLFPNVSVTQVDETGSLTTSRTSLPSVPFLSLGGDSAAAVAVLVALTLPAVQQAREAARRSVSKSNLHQLGLAMYNYEETHKNLPVAAHPNENLKLEKQLSWMYSLLPFLDQTNLFNTIEVEEAWDSDANRQWAMIRLDALQNPGVMEKPGEFPHGHYVGMAGVGKDTLSAKEHDEKTGVFGYNRKTRIADMRDGPSNTIMVTEASKDLVPWAQAKGSIRALTKKPYINGPDGIGGPFRGGLNVLMGDGAVRFVSESIDPEVFEALITVQGGEAPGEF